MGMYNAQFVAGLQRVLMRQLPYSMNFVFYRHATFVLRLGEFRLLVDPMYMSKGTALPVPSTLHLERNPLEDTPRPWPAIGRSDLLLITHHHFDHFDRQAARALPKDLIVITPANGEARLRRLGFSQIRPLRPGQGFEVGNLQIRALPVKHAQRLGPLLYKPGVGYLIGLDTASIYISGDTVFFDGILERLSHVHLGLAVFYGGGAKIPVLGRHTLSHREVLYLFDRLRPDKAVVIHLDSLNHCLEKRSELRRMIETAHLSDRILLPLPGEEVVFEPPIPTTGSVR
jgi:L-ascorbate metabolism protein UlaG (beta-lactamase superfamily)